MTSLAHLICVAEGFMEDCDMLIRSLTEKYEKVDWRQFCEHWKELQFDLLFYGRLSGAELVELTEECFQSVRLYMVTETDNFENQVIGIFIAYAISLVQPYSNLCSLRLTPQDVAPLKRVEAIARKDNRTDVLMILGRLYIYSTHCHVSARERAMDYGIRKYYDDTIRVPRTIHRQWHGELNRNNVKSWEKISEFEKKYKETKNRFNLIVDATYPGSKVFMDTAVPIAEEITDSLRALILGPKKEKEKDEETSVSQVKIKAMKNIVDPMKHLTGIDARKAAAVSALKKSPANITPNTTPKSKLKSVRSKIRENSQNVIAEIKALKQYTKPCNKPKPLIKESSTKPLPFLDDDVIRERNSPVIRVDTPEQPFKGFTAEEIEMTNTSLSNSNSDIDVSHIKKTKKRKQNGKQSPKSTAKTGNANLDYTVLEDTNNVQKRKIKKLPQSTFKIIKSKSKTKKVKGTSPKKRVKNKKNCRSKLSSESDTNTDCSFIYNTIDNIHQDNEDCESNTEENIHTCQIKEKVLTGEFKDGIKNLVQCKNNGMTEETNGVSKDFVQYKINDIIIHADQGLPDLEIELIDQYNGPVNNDVMEQIPESLVNSNVSGIDIPESSVNRNISGIDMPENSANTNISGIDIPENSANRNINEIDLPENIKSENEPIETVDGSEETVEVVRILTETEAAVIETRETLVVPRRKRKRASLQSKLRRMGILPVANFYTDETNGS